MFANDRKGHTLLPRGPGPELLLGVRADSEVRRWRHIEASQLEPTYDFSRSGR